MATTPFKYRPSVLSIFAIIVLIFGLWLWIQLEIHDSPDSGYGYIAAMALGIWFAILAVVDFILQLVIRKKLILNIIEGILILLLFASYILFMDANFL